MANRTYNVIKGSLQDQFDRSRAKIQIYAGGFGNGKTSAALVLKVLKVSRLYPGCRILLARATEEDLKKSVIPELLLWTPKAWIKRHDKGEGIIYMANGSQIEMNYVKQKGKGQGQQTSNLLSSSYDLIVIDQIEDPGITYKDFLDLLGRLRGQTEYYGDDPSMPKTGPRWLILTANPTRNWFYQNVIRPWYAYVQTGVKHPKLIVDPETKEPYQKDGTPYYDLIEGPTYANRANLPDDFIDTLLASYHGVMRERFIEGKWVGYEGLVYPTFDETVHCCANQQQMLMYHNELLLTNKKMRYTAGYDYGMAVPNAFGVWFIDSLDRKHLVSGFYEAELTPAQIESRMKAELNVLGLPARFPIYSDPSIFRRTPGNSGLVGDTVANMLDRGGQGVNCIRGNNAFRPGYQKITQYLEVIEGIECPYTNQPRSPHLYAAQELDWFATEFLDYYWDKNTEGEAIDKARGVRDHAPDMTRYAFTSEPELITVAERLPDEPPPWMLWHEVEDADETSNRSVRYGYGRR